MRRQRLVALSCTLALIAGAGAFANDPADGGVASASPAPEQAAPSPELPPPPPPPPPPRAAPRARSARIRPADARQGLLFSFGTGGASVFSSSGVGRTASFDYDLRLGYGFSDRFQLFADFDAQPADFGRYGGATNWTATLRGQTVLVGDRRGNGLNLNGGIGLGGFSGFNRYAVCYYYQYQCFDGGFGGYGMRRQIGFAVAGGLSYDARIGPHFALSPELFGSWHTMPNAPGYANDIATAWGLRLNLLWYLR